jgi:CMP-N,N'-diacetyllegionaminic acid synthase
MRAGRRILGVVPARGGSKGVELKNLRPVRGRPLVAMAGDLVKSIGWFDRAVVSTDHDEIAEVAESSGLDAPFRRPESLSGDRIGDVEVLVHALSATEEADGSRYDIVVMLQPTSPLRTAAQVTATVDRLIKDDLDAVWTVSPTDLKYHPKKQLVLDEEGLRYWDPQGGNIIARQQLSPVYHRNGAAYALTRECLLEQSNLMGRRSGAVIINEPMISIDTLGDFDRVEAELASRDSH